MPVYMVRVGDNGPVKIGWSARSPEKRVRSLQCGHHQHLRIIRTVDGPREAERWMHEFFRAQRLRGEWFKWSLQMTEVTLDQVRPLPKLPRSREVCPSTVIWESELLAEIEACIARTGETPSAFGRRAAGDPSLVADLKVGRSVGIRLRQRIHAAMAQSQTESESVAQ